ncbi:hypothetical protein ACJIZ3_021145 [Penstemon smallii]|uniref:Uncharacterized protein n=1 Tax=Penstemon smallii TaxID=265156 RepID=A0ABD3SL67_9LAMI
MKNYLHGYDLHPRRRWINGGNWWLHVNIAISRTASSMLD